MSRKSKPAANGKPPKKPAPRQSIRRAFAVPPVKESRDAAADARSISDVLESSLIVEHNSTSRRGEPPPISYANQFRGAGLG